MGLLDFLFFSAVMNSSNNRKSTSSSHNSNYGSSSYESGYEDGYEDSCYDHDCGDSEEHDDYYCNSCDHEDYSYGGDSCDCDCDGGDW